MAKSFAEDINAAAALLNAASADEAALGSVVSKSDTRAQAVVTKYLKASEYVAANCDEDLANGFASPQEAYILYGIEAEANANAAVWSDTLGAARGYAGIALDCIAQALNAYAAAPTGTMFPAGTRESLLFWQSQLPLIVQTQGDDDAPAPMWGTMQKAFLDQPSTKSGGSSLWWVMALAAGAYLYSRKG